jgi:uncharacterized linocin/CFP29 family protein
MGREQLPWSQEVWNRIDRAVHDEAKRTKVAEQFLRLYGPVADSVDNVPAVAIQLQGTTLTVQRGATTTLTEIGVPFAMTQQQVEGEEQLSTAVDLATRATNVLSQAMDHIIFQGQKRTTRRGNKLIPLLQGVDPQPRINHPDPVGGLLNTPNLKAVPVDPLLDNVGNPITDAAGRHKYGENTFAGVVQACAELQTEGHSGAYAFVAHPYIFADAHAPPPGSLFIPADSIRALMGKDAEGGHMFYGTGALEPSTGLMCSVGGSTMDLVSGNGIVTTFVQKDTANMYQFRVVERFTVRVKDETALVRLDFN